MLGCPSWFVLFFLCLLVLHLFWGWGGLVTGLWLSCDSWVWESSDARLRRPDAVASGRTLSFCHWFSSLWVCSDLGWWPASVPRFLPSFGGAPFPCPGFSLATLAVGWSRHLLFSWALPWFFPSRFQCWLLAWGGWGFSLVVLPPWLCCGGCYPGYVSGTCWLALIVLLCPWPLGSCGVPSLLVRSPVSGPVCVLPQSTIVTWLSLLWLGLLLVLVRFHCLWLTLWASACVGPHGCPAFSWVGAVPLTWVLLLWPGWVGRLPLFSFSSVFLRDVVTLWGH